MQVVYAAPNRSHHYPYALALHQAGALAAFVSGFPRLSRASPFPEIGGRLKRRDGWQIVYLLALRFPVLRTRVADWLAYRSKWHLDSSSYQFAKKSDIFIAYNGCGLDTFLRLKGTGVLRIIEVVNSHVDVQEQILSEEHAALGLPYRGILPAEKNRRLREYEEADYILCPSSFVERSLLSRGISAHKIIKNTYGFRSLPNSDAPPSSRPPGRVLYVGTISVRKGLRYLVEGFCALKRTDIELWLVGPITDATGLENHLLPPNVKLKGILKGEMLSAAYRGSSIFVLPSIEEGQALVTAEALSFGLPVIATQNSGADDIITDGLEGFIVEAKNSAVIKEKLSVLLEDANLRLRMSDAASVKAKHLGGWASSGQNLVAKLGSLRGKIRNEKQ